VIATFWVFKKTGAATGLRFRTALSCTPRILEGPAVVVVGGAVVVVATGGGVAGWIEVR
jgi:hypothetical protein